MSTKKKPFKPVADFSKLTMIEHVEIIAIQAFDSELSEGFRDLLHPHTKVVADFYSISENQAILLSVLITINLQTSSVDFAELAHYFDVNCITLAKYIPDLKILIDRQFLRATTEENRKRRRQSLNTQEYYINRDFYQALLKAEKFSPQVMKAVDVFDFLKTVGQIIRGKEELDNESQLYVEINSVFKENQHIQFLQDLKTFDLDDQSLLIYLMVCSEYVFDPKGEFDFSKMIFFLFPDIQDNMAIRKQFLNETHMLQKQDLLELERGSFRNDNLIFLTDKSWGMLVGENKELFNRTKVASNKQFQIIKAEDIIKKKLFYTVEEQKEIDFIVDILQPENYKSMMERLADEGLPQGLCLLFFGEAGTSKTQLSYQIAKKTGRDIFSFKISEGKSMFYGESQKLVKKSFDFYREMVEKSPVAPIFLLNEADGILSKRSNNSYNQSVTQTENAIQTILLNELENINGILIAALNNQNQLDTSFFRRFLVKKEFLKPTSEVRMRIWADKLPWLNPNELEILSKFEITGALIENVQRKLVLQRALYGVGTQNLDQIIKYLREEEINKPQERSKIGFVR
ncbi:MAG: AAA family ATPase [Bacteroidetes bacterium]|nr:AAA family ATPase [Bacteroidota bacterium]